MDLKLLESYTPSVGAEPYRSYYIPYGKQNDGIRKEDSDRVTMLDSWKFKYYPYYTAKVLTDEPTEEISVPSCWQKLGYDYEQYTNILYPFSYNPPFIDKDNPVGLYTTEINVTKKSGKYYLVFEGVDSAYYLTVNGSEVGYATGAHLMHEFDVTKFLTEGKNSVRVAVFKWCTGSYFEDQDKFRVSGIFRDAYLLNRPEEHIKDFAITTDYSGDSGTINVKTDKPAKISVYDGDELVAYSVGEDSVLSIGKVKLWSSETPNVYKVVLEYNGEFITEYVGIRKIEIDKRTFKINGKPVKFKGVNRHSSTVNGAVETLEDIELDLKIMREHNVNAIRTSHYMPHAYLPRLCLKYGIYVLEECDNENHGAEIAFDKWKTDTWDLMANDAKFLKCYLDRTENMFERDKNVASVIMWSLGNEAGWGKNFEECSHYLHRVDATRPVHYEGYSRQVKNSNKVNKAGIDVYSRMYYSLKDCKKYLSDRRNKLPFVQCEYTHAMGNSCGDIKQYWDIFYNSDNCFGGFIWEWCDHAVVTKNGEFLYGGDSGEFPHSKNFCVDGLVDMDRKFIHSALKEAKEVYAPVDVKYDKGKYTVINRRDFISLDDIKCVYRLVKDGVKLEENELDIIGIEARQSKEFKISITGVSGYYTVDFYFYKGDFEIAKRQVVLSSVYKMQIDKKASGVKVVKEDDSVSITAKSYKATINHGGMISSLYTNKELLKTPMELKIMRALIDNDRFFKDFFPADEYTYEMLINEAKFFARNIDVNNNAVTVTGKYVIDCLAWNMDVKIVYTFYDNGVVNVDASGKVNENGISHMHTRFGFEAELNEELFDRVEYFGRGRFENYEDKKLLSIVGLYNDKITDTFVYYTKPQESGSHSGSRKVKVYGTNEITAYSSNDFSFSLAPCKVTEYPTHRHDMLKKKGVVLNIDCRQEAIGSNSCGPKPEEELRIGNNLHYNFDLIIK